MTESSIPKLPDRSLMSMGVLYRDVQDIEVYIEDEAAEIFYCELLNRLGPDIRIKKVFALRGRNRVIQECDKYSDTFPALFIIDGDLNWVSGEEFPNMERLFVHQCYCVENYLFCENAMIELIVESTGKLARDEAKEKLNWTEIRRENQSLLLGMFIEFATAHSLCPEIPTVSRGIDSIYTQQKKGKLPIIDPDKVKALMDEIEKLIISQKGLEEYRTKRENIKNRVDSFSDPFDAISGKSYLIPLQMIILKKFSSSNVNRSSFIFRLAKYCNLEKLEKLKCAIISEISKEVSVT